MTLQKAWPTYGIDCFGKVYCSGLTKVMERSDLHAVAICSLANHWQLS
jgi:hypothetical protein